MVIQETRKLMFLKSGKCFLRSVTKRWYRLEEFEQGNKEQCLNIIDKIRRHLDHRILETPKSLGVFIENNFDNIRLLIPENDTRRRRQLNEYYSLSIFYQKN